MEIFKCSDNKTRNLHLFENKINKILIDEFEHIYGDGNLVASSFEYKKIGQEICRSAWLRFQYEEYDDVDEIYRIHYGAMMSLGKSHRYENMVCERFNLDVDKIFDVYERLIWKPAEYNPKNLSKIFDIIAQYFKINGFILLYDFQLDNLPNTLDFLNVKFTIYKK